MRRGGFWNPQRIALFAKLASSRSRQMVAEQQTNKTITLNCTARWHLTFLGDRGLKHRWVSNRLILVMLNNRLCCRPFSIAHCVILYYITEWSQLFQLYCFDLLFSWKHASSQLTSSLLHLVLLHSFKDLHVYCARIHMCMIQNTLRSFIHRQ